MPAPMTGPGRHESATYTAPPADDGLVEFLLLALLGTLVPVAKGVWWLVSRHPISCLVTVLFAAALARPALADVTVPLAMLVLAGVMVVRLVFKDWWRARLTVPTARRRTKRWLAKTWPVLCSRVGLVVTDRNRRTGAVTESSPSLTGLRWSENGAVLAGRVVLVPGQRIDDLSEHAERIADAAGAHQARITRTGPGTADLALLYGDPLVEVVHPLRVPDAVDLTALPVGVREDGTPWLLRLAGTHLLVAGVTGSGKGSVVWSILRALAPAIRSGWVQVWAVDGKAGMELAPGAPLFTRLATTVEDGVELLEQAVMVMTDRAARLAGQARTHTPSVEEPLLVVLVDEVALLTAYLPDRKLRDRAERALATLATQGRAPGVALVAALQDPRKEVLGLRNLFPTKVGMRLDEKTQVDMVLGDGARDAGAACHKIPETLPGVAYVKLDGLREPVRVRASYLTDADITHLAATYRAPSSAAVATSVGSESVVPIRGVA